MTQAATALVPNNFPAVGTQIEARQMLEDLGIFAKLTELQRVVITAMARDMLLENPRTLPELAKDCNTAVSSISYMKAQPAFGMALGLLAIAITLGNTGLYVSELHKVALESTGHVKVRALELLLKYGGTLTNKLQVDIRSQTVNNSSDSASGLDSIDKFIITLGAKGWNKERLCTRWDELKSQQAW